MHINCNKCTIKIMLVIEETCYGQWNMVLLCKSTKYTEVNFLSKNILSKGAGAHGVWCIHTKT